MRIGILGAGTIAHKMAETIIQMQGMELYAIGSSSYEKSRVFAEQYQIPKVYGSYVEFVQDENIELVYVATIHTMHFEHAMLCLTHHRNVLVEKPFTVNAEQAKILFDTARKNHVFISEAMWTRFMPSAQYLKTIRNQKTIGMIHSITASIGYQLTDVDRMIKKELGGGALLDIGIYPIHFAMMVMGEEPLAIDGKCLTLPSGVDGIDAIAFSWDNCMAILHATIMSNIANTGYIHGTEGYIWIDDINNPLKIKRFDGKGNCVEELDFSNQITGFEYEIEACAEAISSGKIQCEENPHSLTLETLSKMDTLRKKWNIQYLCD